MLNSQSIFSSKWSHNNVLRIVLLAIPVRYLLHLCRHLMLQKVSAQYAHHLPFGSASVVINTLFRRCLVSGTVTMVFVVSVHFFTFWWRLLILLCLSHFVSIFWFGALTAIPMFLFVTLVPAQLFLMLFLLWIGLLSEAFYRFTFLLPSDYQLRFYLTQFALINGALELFFTFPLANSR